MPAARNANVTCGDQTDSTLPHDGFIALHDFTHQDLPEECRSAEVVNYIKFWAYFTVKVIVKYVSLNRPMVFSDMVSPYPFAFNKGSKERRYSSGMIDVKRYKKITESCPCPICKENQPKKKYWTFVVHTSATDVFDDMEAEQSHFLCFNFDKYELNTKVLYGLKQIPSLYKGYQRQSNRCRVLCVTHDKQLVDTLLGFRRIRNHQRMKSLYNTNVGIMLSYPHGKSLQISVGKILNVNVAISQDNPVDTPINFGEGSEYCLPASHQYIDPEDNSFLQLQPGTHKLPKDMTFSLPKKAAYCHRFKFLDWSCFEFPPDTQIKLREGENVYIPPETTFSRYDLGLPLLYVTYDMVACQGCEGAPLLMDWGGSPLGAFRHFGIDTDNGTRNSGSQFYISEFKCTGHNV